MKPATNTRRAFDAMQAVTIWLPDRGRVATLAPCATRYDYPPPEAATVTVTYREAAPEANDEYHITREAERKHLRPFTDPDPPLRQL